MKKIFTHSLLIAGIALCGGNIQAQTITGSAFPTAGEIFTLTMADTANVSPGAGGAGTNWNFSALTANGATTLDSFLAPSATPYSAVFPTASLAQHDITPGTNYFIYYKNTGSVYERIGNVQPDTVIYTIPAGEFPYPISSGVSLNGNYAASFFQTGLTIQEHGTITGNVDGTGTLVLPTGTYSNVLRTHSLRTEADTGFTTGFTVPITQVFDYYNWYQPNSYYPILSMATSSTSSTVVPQVDRYSRTVGYRQGYAASGIDNINANSSNGVLIYPNPTTDNATMVYEMLQAGESTINVYDLTGRLVQMQTNNSGMGMQTVQIKVAALPVGMYEVRVVNAASASSVKLQIIK